MLVTRENLNEMNVENLRKYASSVGVKKIRSFKKTELIEEVLRVQHEVETHEVEVFGTSCIDNLLKGAVGQAVQNMNLMFGIDETAGLRLKASAF